MKENLFKKFKISMFENEYFTRRKVNNHYKKYIIENNQRVRSDIKIDFYNMLLFILMCVLHPENGYSATLDKVKIFLITQSKKTNKILKLITPAGICKARKRFSSVLLKNIWQIDLLKNHYNNSCIKLWNGFKVCAFDGTDFTLNRAKEILKKFPIVNKEYYSRMRLCVLYDVYSKLPLDIETSNLKIGEREMLSKVIDRIRKKTLLLLDRGYPAYWLYHKLYFNKTNFIIRIGKHIKYKIIKKYSNNDLIIEIKLNVQSKKLCHKNLSEKEINSLPDNIKFRLIKTTMKGFKTRYILTSLLDTEKYEYHDICKLYCDRWIIENYYRELKHIFKIEKFHAKYVDGIYQEIYAAMILTIIFQKYMKKAADLKGVPYDEISIKRTLLLLRDIILLYELNNSLQNFLEDYFINSIIMSAQKKRPDRHYKRQFFRKQKCYNGKSR
jgi:hypothetical protein